MKNQPERRKSPRFSVHIPVTLSVPGIEGETPLIAASLNVSLDGMLCTVDRYIPMSERVQICFAIAETAQYTNYFILECEGTVVRITPEKERDEENSYTIALKFDHLSQADQTILRTIVSAGRLTLLATSTVSVVIPVYNSQETLETLTSRIQSALQPLVQDFEIIFVNDKSHDASWEVITRLVTQDPNIRGINLMRNYGQHNALLAGIQKARYELIVTLDDDLQHPPEEIPKLLSKVTEGYDVVYGKPAHREHSTWRNLSSRLLKIVIKIVLGTEMGNHSSAFRVFRSTLRLGFERFADPQLDLDVLLSWSTSQVTHILVDHQPRQYGKSGYTLGKLLLLAFSILTGYSTLPLRVASGIGLTTAFIGFSMFIYVIVRRLLQADYAPGVVFLASEISFLAGMQLFAIGLLGEYVARLHFRTMGKPTYIIQDDLENDVNTIGEPPSIIRQEHIEKREGANEKRELSTRGDE